MVKVATEPGDASVLVKLEHFNPGGSIKSRVALAMVERAMGMGTLETGDTIVEATGGNTGMGLALVSTLRGFRFIAVVPDNYSRSRLQLLRIHGADVRLSDSSTGNDSHLRLADRLLEDNPSFKHLNQFRNPACIEAHYSGTAVEILDGCEPDAFVCSVGSGGTFSGVGKRLRQHNHRIHLQVVQPAGCDIYNGTAVPHDIQGTALGIRPPSMDYGLVDSTTSVTRDEVKGELAELLHTDGLFLGASSGANIVAAKRLARQMGRGKTVCTVAPDSGEHYRDQFYLNP